MKNGKSIIAEFEHHAATVAMYPFRADIWRENAVYMQKYVLNLVDVISRYEPVILICRESDVKKLKLMVNANITVVPMEYDDIWARDICPTFVKEGNLIKAISWKFNSWGGAKEGSYFPWDKDDAFASKLAKYLRMKCENAEIVLEGGAILTDGEGTLFTTQSVLLNKNRNPFKTKQYIENVLKDYLNVHQIVWLKQGLAFDETNGHIDNVMSIVRPHEVCIAWTNDKRNPNYKRVRRIESDLQSQYECIIHRIPLPSELYMTKREANGLMCNEDALNRKAGDILPASYMNYYLVNDAIIFPVFGCPEDCETLKIIKEIYPDRTIEQIYSREPLLGGGGIHCILHEIPVLGR